MLVRANSGPAQGELKQLLAERERIRSVLAAKSTELESVQAEAVIGLARFAAVSAAEALGEAGADSKAAQKTIERAGATVNNLASTIEGIRARLVLSDDALVTAFAAYESELAAADVALFDSLEKEWLAACQGMKAKALELLARMDARGRQDLRGIRSAILDSKLTAVADRHNVLAFTNSRWDNSLRQQVNHAVWELEPALVRIVESESEARQFYADMKREVTAIRARVQGHEILAVATK